MQTILIVDDDSATLAAWARILRFKNFRVTTATDPAVGLAAANALYPDLIVTDREMPGTDGIEFCRQLRLSPKLAEIPIVLTSAGEAPALHVHRRDTFWQKPIAADVMLESIRELLGSAR